MIPEITNKDVTLVDFSLFDKPLPGNSKCYKIAACVIPLLGLVMSTRIFLSMKKRISLIKPDNVLNVTSKNIVKKFKSRSRQEIKTYLKACLINLFIISAVVVCFLVPQLTSSVIITCISIILLKAFYAFINKINKHSDDEKISEECKAAKDQLKSYDECLKKWEEDHSEIVTSCNSLLEDVNNLHTSCTITIDDHSKLNNLISDVTTTLELRKKYPSLTEYTKICAKDIELVCNQTENDHTENITAIKAAIVDARNRFSEISNRLFEAQKKLQDLPV